jgi:hypothetical protein
MRGGIGQTKCSNMFFLHFYSTYKNLHYKLCDGIGQKNVLTCFFTFLEYLKTYKMAFLW